MDKYLINRQIGTTNKLGEGPTFKISRFEEGVRQAKPHKHEDYYELLFLSEGEGYHCIETRKFTISPPEFYILKPRQLHFWESTAIVKGFIILFKESQFNRIIENDLIDLYKQLSAIIRIKIPNEKYPEPVLNEILTEYSLNTKYSKRIIHGLLGALFGKLMQMAERSPIESNAPASLFDRFQQLLIKESPPLHRVSDYARALHATPQNLNAVCRKQSGHSAREMITHQLMLEAKRYILYTDNTINQITDILSFSDPSNFIKFFKKQEGLTPIQFREEYFH